MGKKTTRTRNQGEMPKWRVIVISVALIAVVALVVIGVVIGLQEVMNRPQESLPIGDDTIKTKPTSPTSPLLTAMTVTDVGDSGETKIKVEPEKTYELQMSVWALYVDNVMPDTFLSNTRVAFSIDQGACCSQTVTGISWAEVGEQSYVRYKDVRFYADEPFWLEYLYGEAKLSNDSLGTVALSDKIVTAAASEHGVQIGTTVLDGDLQLGKNYKCDITIKVVPHMLDYSLSQKWRVVGEDEWHDGEISAAVDAEVEVAIEYKNEDIHSLSDVGVVVQTFDLDVDRDSFGFCAVNNTEVIDALPIVGDLINTASYYDSTKRGALGVSSMSSPLEDFGGLGNYYLRLGDCRPGESVTVSFKATVSGSMPTATTGITAISKLS